MSQACFSCVSLREYGGAFLQNNKKNSILNPKSTERKVHARLLLAVLSFFSVVVTAVNQRPTSKPYCNGEGMNALYGIFSIVGHCFFYAHHFAAPAKTAGL